jgi:sodium-dependent phosphate transporter
MGMALAAYGGKAVQWAPRKKEFPFVGGLVPIFMSWMISPVLAGVFVTLLFLPLRAIVLRSSNSFSRALYVLPLCVFLTFFVLVVFIIQTGYKNAQWKKMSDGKACGIGAAFAACTAVIAALIGWLVLRPQILAEADEVAARVAAAKAAAAEGGDGTKGGDAGAAARAAAMADIDAAAGVSAPSAFSTRLSTAWANFRASRVGDLLTNNVVSRTMSYGATYKVHEHIHEDDRVAELWRTAEVFDTSTERLFRYLQVFTACAMSFAHGSNDVANAMGPFNAVYYTWRNGKVPGSKSNVETWILAMGGAGIVAGLATYGYKIMAVLAVKSVKLTNSRGFVVEMATAMTVVLASRFGLPVSTTQVVCGAVLSMGLMEGGKGVNWRMAARIFVGWVLTIIVATGMAAGFTAFGLYTPNKIASVAAGAVAAAAKAAAPKA